VIDLNPFSALASFILGKMKQSTIALWVKLLFEIWFSATVSFLFVCGTTLIATKSWALSVGAGMIMAACVMTVLFRRTPLTKGLMVVLPAEEAAAELGHDFQTISKEK
jgi:GH24 family phage-related lysozyme (muramidase)